MSGRSADVVIIGAGVMGAATAFFAARAGLSVIVLERGTIASGTSSACEGNVLVSDKEAGPELDLALYSQRVWRDDLGEHGHLWEFEDKGGLVVAASAASAGSLQELTVRQRASGIDVVDVAADQLRDYEPHIARDLVAGAFYPQDAQVQPMLVVGHLLRLARALGAVVLTGTEVTGFLRKGDSITGVTSNRGNFSGTAVVNAAGTWAGSVAALAGLNIPVKPRRGFVLVTEPLPLTIHHKVYAAEYVANVASSEADLQTSPVVEGTQAGTVLIRASRERVGFDSSTSLPVLGLLAQQAIKLFPVLAQAKAIRHYHGFRPYCPDHLPVIGADDSAPGLWHAAGHEGAGIGLGPATAKLLVQKIIGEEPDIDLSPFAAGRFQETYS